MSASDWSEPDADADADALAPTPVAAVADAPDDADDADDVDDVDAPVAEAEPPPTALPMFISNDIRSGAKPPLLLGVISDADVEALPAFALAALVSVASSVEKLPPPAPTR